MNWRWWRSGVERRRRLGEDLLREVAHGRWPEGGWRGEEVLPGADGAQLGEALAELEREGMVARSGAEWRLTETGHGRALELLRAHRVVETYLARKGGRPAGTVHEVADRVEHEYTPEQINELADALNRPRFDPHGDPIPERTHGLAAPEAQALSRAAEGTVGRILHIEDEPREDFHRLEELGLAPELPVRVLRQTQSGTVLELAGERLALPAKLALHVEIGPFAAGEEYPEDLRRLSRLKTGERGVVAFISPACMGPERRRLLDFGLVPGSEVRREFSSTFGSPIAYSVRGTTLGLRREQARNIFIRRTS